MQPRQLFGVAIRASGLVFLAYSLFDLVYVIAMLTGIPISSPHPLAADAWACGILLFICAVLLRGADWIVCFAYGRERNPPTN